MGRKRIGWIDWAKFIAITLVIIGHIPLGKGHPVTTYINYFHMPLFMFISGLLTRRDECAKENMRKDWTTIVRPLFIYNLIFYPYWIVKSGVADNLPFNIHNYIVAPVVGVVSLSTLAPLVNGPTWFLVALLFSHVVIDIGAKFKHNPLYYLVVCVLAICFDATNERLMFTSNRTYFGFARCLPFYIIGFKLHGMILAEKYTQRMMLLVMCVSAITFLFVPKTFSSIHAYPLYVVANLTVTAAGIIMMICFTMLLDRKTPTLVKTISIGTLPIFGIHWMMIGTTNFILQKLYGIEEITYTVSQAILLALLFEIAIFPLIKIAPPALLGKKKKADDLISSLP